MSTTSLDILVRARDEASRVINGVSTTGRKLGTEMDTAGKKTSRLGSFFGSTAGKLAAFAGGAFALKGAFDFGKEAIANAEDAQRSMSAFNATLERTGQISTVNADKFNEWAKTFGESIGTDDENLRDLGTTLASQFDFRKLADGPVQMAQGVANAQAAVQKLSDAGKEGTTAYAQAVRTLHFEQDGYNKAVKQSGQDSTKWLEMSVQSISDVAAATQKSPGLIKRMFSSLLNDPAAAVSQLQKLGAITEEQANHFKTMAESGNAAGATQQMLTLLSQKYAGAAEANSTASERLSTVWENMKESLGNFLLPLFDKGANLLVNFVGSFRDMADAANNGKGILGAVVSAFHTLVAAGAAVIGFLKGDLLNIWNALAETWRSSLAPALSKLWDALVKLKPVAIVLGAVLAVPFLVLIKVLPLVIRAVGFVVDALASAIDFLAGIFGSIGTIVVNAAKSVITAFQPAITWFINAWHAIQPAVETVFKALTAFIKAEMIVWGAIFKAAFTVLKVVWAAVKPYFTVLFKAVAAITRIQFAIISAVFRTAYAVVRAVWGPAQAFFTGIFNAIKAVAIPVWNAVTGAARGAWNLIKSAWREATGFFRGLFNGVKGIATGAWTAIVNSLKVVWNGLANLWNSTLGNVGIHFHHAGIDVDFDVPTLPTLAKGGIALGPTLALIGEAGPEAVIPLSKMGSGPREIRIDRRKVTAQLTYDTRFHG